jgi:nicotinamidase-related amidase
MSTALLVIDPQADFVPLCHPDPAPALAAMLDLIAAARAGGVPVVVTQELHRPGGIDMGRELDGDEPLHCIEGTPGAELLPGFAGDHLVAKRRYSAFFGTDLQLLLQGLGVDRVVVCGMLSDVCVHLTCADAHQHDLHVHVVPEACAGSSAAAAEAAFANVEYLQHGAVLTLAAARAQLESIGTRKSRAIAAS